MCVQNFDDSREIAIRITYRISLRSSSLWEPRHPLLKVVSYITFSKRPAAQHDNDNMTMYAGAASLFNSR